MKKCVLPMTERNKLIPSSFDFFAGFGTLLMQVAGFHRAVPSAALDKAYLLDNDDCNAYRTKPQALHVPLARKPLQRKYALQQYPKL